MQAILKVMFLVLVAAWTSAEPISVGGLSEEQRPPYGNNDPVQQILPQLTQQIRSQVITRFNNDTSAQNAVKDTPIQVLAYRSQVVSGVTYYVKARLATYFFHLRIYNPATASAGQAQQQAVLQGVKGPMPESAPLDQFNYELNQPQQQQMQQQTQHQPQQLRL